MEIDKVKELFNATAEMTEEGKVARKEFASALTTPILQKIELESIMRSLFTVEKLAPGEICAPRN
jgi:hypothetical protein